MAHCHSIACRNIVTPSRYCDMAALEWLERQLFEVSSADSSRPHQVPSGIAELRYDVRYRSRL